jgi:Trypsin-like serine proteases, typically periplasmic, contain C-terminal PDZ domain
MSDYNNNDQNQGGSRNDNGSNNNELNRMPEYSFWAEQMPNDPNVYHNQGTNTWQQSNPNAINNDIPLQKDEKKRGKGLKLVAKAICFGLIAAITFILSQELYHAVNPSAASGDLISTINKVHSNAAYKLDYTSQSNVVSKDQTTITNVTKATLPAIVSINCTSTQPNEFFGQQFDQQVEGSGSGIIVGKNDKELLIATNNHVVEGANKISVTFIDGTEATAEVKGTDASADLAVITVNVASLKSSTLQGITVAKLGNSDQVKVGELAVAIGNALGYGQSVTVGYISAKDREVQVSDGYDNKTMTLLQTDAAINPGNSGGALLNVKGEVIGINTVKYASNEVEGMGYAIPISKATPIINELMSREILSDSQKGYLGITGTDVTEDAAKFYNIPIGVYVENVAKGGAAENAGLKSEDIITKVNDLKVTSITQLKDKVNSMKVGTQVEITYMRNTDGKYHEAKVKTVLGQNPELSNSNK